MNQRGLSANPLARGMVTLAEEASETPNSAAREVLVRAFAFLERGMRESEEGPIPNLIRTTMCDWLGVSRSRGRCTNPTPTSVSVNGLSVSTVWSPDL